MSDNINLSREIRFTRSLTDGIVGVNVMVAVRGCKELSLTAIEEGVDILVIGAGFAREGDVENGIFTIGKQRPRIKNVDNLPTVVEVIDEILGT